VLVFHLFLALVSGKWGVGRESWGSLFSILKSFDFFWWGLSNLGFGLVGCEWSQQP